MLTNYQISEVSLGTIYFFFLCLMGIYLSYGTLDLYNAIIMTLLVGIWLYMMKLIPIYLNNIRYN